MDLVLIMEIPIVYIIQEGFQHVCIVNQDIVFFKEVAINVVDVMYVQLNSFVQHLVKVDIHLLIMHA